jgi:predicted lipid-binding transport protein (Tim44 family)
MEIIVFAILSLYLFFRLWSVLGTRTGHEKKMDPFKGGEEIVSDDNVVVFSKRASKSVQTEQSDFSSLVASQINRLMKLDKGFDPAAFLRGAQSAFLSIIRAFAEANHLTLKNLLSQSVYEQFAAALEDRERKGLRQETEIEDISAEILNIDLLEDKAQITVRFKSQQMMATFNESGESFDNPARLHVPMIDVWTFEKQFNSKSSIWVLVRTRTDAA